MMAERNLFVRSKHRSRDAFRLSFSKLRRAGFLCAAQTAEANEKVGLGALEAGVTPGSRQPLNTLFAVPCLTHIGPPSQGQPMALISLPYSFYAARRFMLPDVRTDDGDDRPAAVRSLAITPAVAPVDCSECPSPAKRASCSRDSTPRKTG